MSWFSIDAILDGIFAQGGFMLDHKMPGYCGFKAVPSELKSLDIAT
jgi:hypothetical protein